MTQLYTDNIAIKEEDISSLACQLKNYSKTLSERELQILAAIIFRVMDPLERMRWRDTTHILDAEEEAILQSLEDENKVV